MTDRAEPYIHSGYFNDRSAAERCRAEFADLGYRVAPVSPTEEGDPWGAWLVRAARMMVFVDWEAETASAGAIIERFGGYSDGSYWELGPDEWGEGWHGIEPPA